MRSAINDLVSSTRSVNIGDENDHFEVEHAISLSAAATDKYEPVVELEDSEEGPSEEPAFVNMGLQRWEKLRKEWLSSSPSASSQPMQQEQPRRVHAREVDVDEVIDLVVSNRWRQQPQQPASSMARRKSDACFPRPVALPQMVDILVDLWEAEGLDI